MLGTYNQKKLIGVLVICVTVLNAKNSLFCSETLLNYQTQINIVTIGFCIALFVITFVFNKNVRWTRVILSLFAFSLMFLIQFLMFPENSSYVMDMLPLFVMYGLLPFFLTISITDFSTANRYFYYSAVALFVVSVFALLVVTIEGNRSNLEYSMPYGNALTFSAIIIFSSAFKYNNKKLFIVFAIECLLIIMVGSRGPILSLVAFLFLYLFFYWRPEKRHRKTLFLSGFLLLIVAIIYNVNSFILLIQSMIEKIGFHSRTIDLFLSSNIDNISGRDIIYQKCLEYISAHPFIGIGIEGLQGNGYLHWSPHNLLLELLLSFGIPLGLVFTSVLAFLYIKGVFLCKNSELQLFNLILFSQYVPRCIFGAGLFESSWFWLLLGGCICAVRKANNHRTGESSCVASTYDKKL